MSINKKFDAWIASNFRGLSPHTLCQIISLEYFIPKHEISNMVYVDLFKVFNRTATDKEQYKYQWVNDVVARCDYL